MKNKIIIIFLLSLAILPLVGCEGGGIASCKEACEQDSDCQYGYRCLVTISRGQSCLPEECATCFESSRTCYYEENDYEQEQGEEATCTFRACD